MTVKQYLELNKPEKYVITDRMRTPISQEQLKWLNLSEIEVRRTDIIDNGTIRIHSDYMSDAC